MGRNEHYVTPNTNGGWDVNRNNAKRVSAHTDTKIATIKLGR